VHDEPPPAFKLGPGQNLGAGAGGVIVVVGHGILIAAPQI
jgi:hypothetical protein